jgi:hypothetical protein
MFNVAHVLSPSMVTALAAHFRDLNPKPLGGAPKEPLAMGKTIYEQGVPEANIPPCSSCHGRCGGVARRIASRGSGCTGWPPTGFPNRESFIRILTSVSPSHTQGWSRVRDSRPHGSGRGVVSNDRPYRTSLRGLRLLTLAV